MSRSSKTNTQDNSDLDSADWLTFTIRQMVLNVNPNIPLQIIKGNNKRLIVINNISETDILNLLFLTNTNDNNNYLYLEDLSVYLDNNTQPIDIPGLHQIALDISRNADSVAYLDGNQTFKMFGTTFKIPNGNSYENGNFNQFVDYYTSLVSFFPQTTNHKKQYRLILNPDCIATGVFCIQNPSDPLFDCCSDNECLSSSDTCNSQGPY
jgi:hypothetical protein